MTTGFVPAESVQGGWMWSDEVYFTNIVFLLSVRGDPTAGPRGRLGSRDLRGTDCGRRVWRIDAQGGRFVGCRVNGARVAAVWVNPHAGSSTIAHEAFHATYYVLEHAGMGLNGSSEEAWAYHLAG